MPQAGRCIPPFCGPADGCGAAWAAQADRCVLTRLTRSFVLTDSRQQKSNFAVICANQTHVTLACFPTPILGSCNTDGQLMDVHWSEMRERLRCNLRDFAKTVDTALLIEQLLRPQDWSGGRSLVTPKAAGLVALLCEYKVAHQCKPAGSCKSAWTACLVDSASHALNRRAQFPNRLNRTGIPVPCLSRILSWHTMALTTASALPGINVAHTFQDACIAAQTKDGQPWSCIVFAQQKITCLALARLLKACERHLDFLKCSSFMGFGGKHTALSQTIQVRPCLSSSERYGRRPDVTRSAGRL